MPDEPHKDDHGHERDVPSPADAGGGGCDCFHARVDNSREAIARVEAHLVRVAKRFGYEHASRFALRLAFEEAITNALHHGHCDLPDSEPVEVCIEIDPHRVRIVIEDRGPGFAPGCVPDPTCRENLDKPCGRGLMLIRAYMTSVRYNDAGNRVEMIYTKPGDHGSRHGTTNPGDTDPGGPTPPHDSHQPPLRG